MKSMDCSTCRKRLLESAQEAYLKQQYRVYTDAAYTFAVYATAAVLMAQIRRGRSKEYIKKLYDDIVLVYDTPQIFGKPISLTDIMHTLESEYGIDFKRIHITLETEKQFISGVRKAVKDNERSRGI